MGGILIDQLLRDSQQRTNLSVIDVAPDSAEMGLLEIFASHRRGRE